MTRHDRPAPVDPTLPRRIDAYRNRERILERAIATLRADRAATFEQIIAATGPGRTTVYRHFPRAALIDAIVARLLDAVRDLLERARPAGGTAPDWRLVRDVFVQGPARA